ncbi:MAG: hypothetical protein MI923_21275 [Phycisphaerales bacterium]|nr:hypothetical protein [Phycisphaerales bacterium]
MAVDGLPELLRHVAPHGQGHALHQCFEERARLVHGGMSVALGGKLVGLLRVIGQRLTVQFGPLLQVAHQFSQFFIWRLFIGLNIQCGHDCDLL